ncbi:MAG: SulP family inorganic anion transporter [Bacteroidota bacterium]
MNQLPNVKEGFFANLKSDLPASVVVFLVAMPLCLGIALASGAPLFSGIIAGIIGGIVVGAISGSQLGVSGPAAGLAVIVLTAIQELGAYETFLLAVVIGGIIQTLLGFAKAGIIGYYFPSSVIKGMLAGIGIIIILKQIPHAVGYDKDFEGSLAFNQPDGHNTLSELFYMFQGISPGAVAITLISLAILILWEQPFMKKQSFSKIIQGPLVVVISAIFIGLALQGTEYALRGEQMVNIPVAESISGFFGQFTMPDFSQLGNPAVYITGITIAVVASLETLLCLEATDKLDPYKRVSPANLELKAQGVGNVVSGLIGGLPITQVIVRSSTNIQSGGKTKASAIIHGCFLILTAMLIPNILNMIPLASLAAILFLVGYKLAKPVLFKEMYAAGKEYFVPFMVTIIGIVLTDLLMGIGLGMVVAIFYVLYKNYQKPYQFDISKEGDRQVIRLELSEDVTFLNKANILKTLNQIPDNTKVIIDASRSIEIDKDVVEIISDFKQGAQYKDIEVEFIGRKISGMAMNATKLFEKSMSEHSEPQMASLN